MRRAARPRVLEQLANARLAVIEASAGTGKTFTLEHLVVELILGGTPVEGLLAVTFTEKAAAELSARLRAKISRLAFGLEPEPAAGELAWSLDEEAQSRLDVALADLERLSVFTLHGFCQRVLVEHAFEHGRPFTQTVVDDRAAFEAAFVHTLRTELGRRPEYRPWLEAWLSRARLDRLSRLAFTCLARGGQIAPRFDPAALERAKTELRRAPTAWRAVRPLLARAGFGGPRLGEMEERLGELRDALDAEDGPSFLSALKPNLVSSLEAELRLAAESQPGLRHLSSAVQQLGEAAVTLESAVLQVVLPPITRTLEAEKKRSGQLDFGDMLRQLAESLDGPGTEPLVARLRSRFPAALIDEFQDTDAIQWRIFRRLYLEPGATGRLFLIGDPKQSIYGFRGADVRIYLSARDDIEAAGGRRVALSTNHRSTKALVIALNRLLDPSAPQPFFPGPIRYDVPVEAGRTDGGALLEGGAPGPPAVLLVPALEEAPPGSGGAEKALFAAIADEAARLLDSLQVRLRTAEGIERPLAPRDLFVLVRSAREGREVAAALEARGVPAAPYKQEGLLSGAEAADIEAVLAAIADPYQRSLRLLAWRTPFFGVPAEQLDRCLELGPEDRLLGQLLAWKALADARDYPRLFASVVRDGGLVDRLGFSPKGDRALTNFLHLLELVQELAADGRPPIGELLARFVALREGRARPPGLEGDVERLASEQDAVQIMTQHKAKGLEAEVVFLCGGLRDPAGDVHPFFDGRERRLFVGREPPESALAEAEAEARRLLYVALTRARTRLYVPWFGTGPDGGPAVDGLGGSQAVLEPHIEAVASMASAASHADSGVWEVRRAAAPPPPPSAEDIAAGVARWRLPPAPPAPAEPAPVRLGPTITSYSRMKAEEDEEPETPAVRPEPAPEDELPGGAASGRFLHDLLERVDFSRVGTAEAFFADPEIQRLADRLLERHRRKMEHRAHGLRLVHAALTAPLGLGGDQLDGGLVGAERVARELGFLFPLPKDPALGFVKGFIDVVFEHRGRLYVLDWKSDALPAGGAEGLDRYVRDRYLLQAEIYAVAAAKLAGADSESTYEARCGGALYVFLRGLDDPKTAQWFLRPTWAELKAAAARLDVPLVGA